MVVRTLAFVIVRRVLGLVGLGPAPDDKAVEIAVLSSGWPRRQDEDGVHDRGRFTRAAVQLDQDPPAFEGRDGTFAADSDASVGRG
jgi:hypothetical protein